MAIIDTKRDVVVVRIVYDGPPQTGKTTSIHALKNLLGKDEVVIFSPEHAEGKTLYFDWMEYIGGFFKGYSISCQIVTVPGQLSLAERRHFLLRTADVVIFVLDANRTEAAVASNYFNDLQQVLADQATPVKIVVQANKQDKEEVLSTEQLKTIVFQDKPDIKIVESIAIENKGIREAFVLAVRFAVERADKLMAQGKLEMGQPEITSGEALLASLQQNLAQSPAVELAAKEISPSPSDSAEMQETPTPPSSTASMTETSSDNTPIQEASMSSSAENDLREEMIFADEPPESAEQLAEELTWSEDDLADERKRFGKLAPTDALQPTSLYLPQPDIPARWIWPPLSGTHYLTTLCQHALKPKWHPKETAWVISVEPDHWYGFSRTTWYYAHMRQAQEAFRHHISLHLRCSPLLAQQRCIIAVQGHQGWRLWQFTRCTELSLAQRLAQTIQYGKRIDKFVSELVKCAKDYLVVLQYCHHYPAYFSDFALENFHVTATGQVTYLSWLDDCEQADDLYEITVEKLNNLFKQAFAPFIKTLSLPTTEVMNALDKLHEDEFPYLIQTIKALF